MLRHVTTALSGDCPYVVSQTADLGRFGAVNYRLQGSEDDPLVVCFHGLNASVAQFDGLAAFLISFNYQVLAFDLLGHGLSEGLGKKEYSPSDFVGQATALLEFLRLGNRKHHVVGFSLGGLIAALYSLQQGPSKVETVTLLGPAGLVLNRRRSFNVCLSAPMVYLTVPAVKCAWGVAASTVVSAPLYANFNSSSRKLCRHQSNNWKCACRRNLDTALKVARGMPLSNASSAFRQLFQSGIPTLIGWGSRDTVLPVKKATNVVIGLCKQTAGQCNVCYSTYADCGHQLLHEDFHTVATDILCHLQHRRLPEKPAVNRRFFGYPEIDDKLKILMPENNQIKRRASCGDIEGCNTMTPLSTRDDGGVAEFLDSCFSSDSPRPPPSAPVEEDGETSSTATGGQQLLASRSVVLSRKPKTAPVAALLTAKTTAVKDEDDDHVLTTKSTTIDTARSTTSTIQLPALMATANSRRRLPYRNSLLKEAEEEVVTTVLLATPTSIRHCSSTPVINDESTPLPDLFSRRLLLSCCVAGCQPTSD